MKVILGVIMAAAIAGVAFVQPAEARCFPDRGGVTCVHQPMFGMHHWYRGGFERPHYYRNWY
ncbi:MAG: hypothetical protein JO162_09760 [Alphaproteobacteria bacterium]|nr:hypothetical protein [Alphaproteobacteria bacterium]MBV9017391.1 hypothetical protein [Alphaproteobacteria bacterium]MBV9152457.1 hypothetical protein [Alphaproteobacteria bacterium]MBV9586366.1 hypothetical protein [Alphaproteobacteria bacterium]MBV9968277.1 hypothetical protein [Alphaproteobacteria bacterium]